MNMAMRCTLCMIVYAAAAMMLGASAQVVHEGNCVPVQVEETVTSHASQSLDVRDIVEALRMSPPDFDAARDVYTNGAHASCRRNPDGFRGLKKMATKNLTFEPLHASFAKLYDSVTWLDDYMTPALDGTGVFEGRSDELRVVAATRGALAILTLFTNYEISMSMYQAEEGVPLNGFRVDSNFSNIHWDEGFAFYYGFTGENAPVELSRARDADFGTSVVTRALDDFSIGRSAALAADVSGMRAVQRSLGVGYLITSLQSVLKYTYQLQFGDGDDAEWAEAYTSWRTWAGAVAEHDFEAAQRIEAILSLSASIDDIKSSVYCSAKAEIEAALPVMGVRMADLGNLSEDNGNGIIIQDGVCQTDVNGDQTEVNGE